MFWLTERILPAACASSRSLTASSSESASGFLGIRGTNHVEIRNDTQPGNRFATHAGLAHRQRPAVDRDHVSAGDQVPCTDLQTFDRRVDETRRAARPRLLAEHRPRLQRMADFDFDVLVAEHAVTREAEFIVRREPRVLEGEAGAIEVGDDLAEIAPVVERQHPAVVQGRSPAHQWLRVRLAPEPGDQRAHQQLLHEAHARVRRHLETAQLDEAEPAARTVGRIQLVDAELGAVRVAGQIDEQVAQRAVDDPRRDRQRA